MILLSFTIYCYYYSILTVLLFPTIDFYPLSLILWTDCFLLLFNCLDFIVDDCVLLTVLLLPLIFFRLVYDGFLLLLFCYMGCLLLLFFFLLLVYAYFVSFFFYLFYLSYFCYLSYFSYCINFLYYYIFWLITFYIL